MFYGKTKAGSTIDATRWARSAGLDTRCCISVDLISAIAPPGLSDCMHVEKVAATAMAILARVRRAMDGTEDSVRCIFKAGSNGSEQPLEATYVADEQGRLLLVRRG